MATLLYERSVARFPVLRLRPICYVPAQPGEADFRPPVLGPVLGTNVLAPRPLVAVARVGGRIVRGQPKPELVSLPDSGATQIRQIVIWRSHVKGL